jgi:hypothetical protein
MLEDPLASIRKRSLAGRGAFSVAGSLVANLGLVALADAIGIAPDLQALDYGPVAFFSTLGVIGAVLFYAILEDQSRRPDAFFDKVALAVLAVSFVSDVILWRVDETATLAGVGVLAAMHAIVAGLCLAAIPARN